MKLEASRNPRDKQEDRPFFESLRIAFVFCGKGNFVFIKIKGFNRFWTSEADLSEVPLLNFLRRPVFLLSPDLFIVFITGKEMLKMKLINWKIVGKLVSNAL